MEDQINQGKWEKPGIRMSELLWARATWEFACAKWEGNYLQTHAAPSQVLTFETFALAFLKTKVFLKRLYFVVSDCLLRVFPLSGCFFLWFFCSAGLPLRIPALLCTSLLNDILSLCWTKRIGCNHYLVKGSSLLLLYVSLHCTLHPSILFPPSSFALKLPQNDSCSCLPGLSSNPHIVLQPLANSPMGFPAGLVKVRSRSNTQTKFDWEKPDVCLLNLLQARGSSPHINTLPISCQQQADHRPRSMHIFFYFLQRDSSQRKSQRHWETTQMACRPALNS